MAAVFGLHVGNSTACLACFKDGNIEVLANEAGYRVTPAVVAFHESEKLTGLEAKANMVRNFSSTIVHNKLFMYASPTEDSALTAESKGKVFIEEGVIKYRLQQGEKEVVISPDEVATCIYRSMLKIATSAARSEDTHKAVLTVPPNLSEEALARTRLAAEEAGFDVLQLVSEPCAAVMAYQLGLQDPSQSCLCLVYRLGGASIDASIVRVAGGVYSMEGFMQSKELGGDALNKILANFIATEFERKYKLDPHESKRSMAKLLSAAENWKHILSNLGSADCFLESLHEGIDFRFTMSRARFEMLISSALQDCLQPIQAVLKKTGLDASKITHVVICGGSLKIPRLQKAVAELFPDAEMMSGLSPDEVLAVGAARQASFLPSSWDKSFADLAITVAAVTKGIFVKLSSDTNGGWQCVIPAHAPIPFVKQIKCTVPKNQTSIIAEIGEELNTLKNYKSLGRVELSEMVAGASATLELKWTNAGLQASLADNTNKRSVVVVGSRE